jgi:hypothetical protein
MTKMTQAEYQGRVDWLRSHPHGMVAQAVRRELRAFEAELKSQGKTVGGVAAQLDDPESVVRQLSPRPAQAAADQQVSSQGP